MGVAYKPGAGPMGSIPDLISKRRDYFGAFLDIPRAYFARIAPSTYLDGDESRRAARELWKVAELKR